MWHLRTRLYVLAAAVLTGVAATTGCTAGTVMPGSTTSTSPGTGGDGANGSGSGTDGAASAGIARGHLAGLTVVTSGLSMAGYSRTRFHIWAGQGGRCNTRDVVLKRDGHAVAASATCTITSGTWISPYNGRTYTDPLQMDIDHVVPLANAWRSGAKNWTDTQREQFANDLTRPQLLAVDLSDNRAKGDQDPSQWKPPRRAFWCRYAEDWVAVKAHYRLTVMAPEKAALTDMLATCR